MPNLDELPENQDWTKQTVDIIDFDGTPEEFRERIEETVGLEMFRKLPVFLLHQDHPLFSEIGDI